MNPKRKKIYIIIITTCVTLIVGIFLWDKLSVPQVEVLSTIPPETSSGTRGIFPASTVFKTEVLESEAFRDLNKYPALNVTGQIGREDPFRSY